MKRTILLFTTVLLLGFTSSCSDEISGTKKNWLFTITVVTTATPAMEGYPQTITQTVEQNGLTTAEADAVVKENTSTTTMTMGDVSLTMKSTCTKEEKK